MRKHKANLHNGKEYCGSKIFLIIFLPDAGVVNNG